MGPTPPRNKGIGIALPPFRCQERGCGLSQSRLHIDHSSVLVEHADLDGSPQIIRLRHRLYPKPLEEPQPITASTAAKSRCTAKPRPVFDPARLSLAGARC